MARKSRSKQRGKGVGSRSQSAGKSKGGSRSSAGSKGGSKSGGNKSGSGKSKSSKSKSTKSKSTKSTSPSGNKRGSGKAGQGTAGGGQKSNPTQKAPPKKVVKAPSTPTKTPTKKPNQPGSGVKKGNNKIANLPSDYKKTEQQAFNKAETFKKQQAVNKDRSSGKVANLPSDYKETEQKAFDQAAEFKRQQAAEAAAKAEADRLAAEKAEQERLAKAEQERLAAEQAERDRLAAEAAAQAEAKRLAEEKAERERLAEEARQKELQRQREFDPEGRLVNDDMMISSAFSAGSGLFGDDIDVGDGVFRTKDQIIKMRDNPQNFNLDPGSRLFKQIQEAGKGLVNTVFGGPAVAAEKEAPAIGFQGDLYSNLTNTFSPSESRDMFSQEVSTPDISSTLSGTGLNIGDTASDTATAPSEEGTSRALDPTEPGLSIQEKAARRDAIFRDTGVQTYGGTRDVYGYSKAELDKLRAYADKSGLSFGSVIGQKGTKYPGQLGVSEEEIALNNAYNYREDGLVMNSIGQFVTPEQRAIDDADAGPSIGRSIATGFNNLVDKIPIIGKKLPNLKTDYTRAEQNLLKKTTPFKSGSRTKTGAVNRRGGGGAAMTISDTPLAVDPEQQIEDAVGTGTTTQEELPSLADIQNDSYQDTLSDLLTIDPETGQATGTGGTGGEGGDTSIEAAIARLFDPNYSARFRFRGRGRKRGGFRKAFSRRYF